MACAPSEDVALGRIEHGLNGLDGLTRMRRGDRCFPLLRVPIAGPHALAKRYRCHYLALSAEGFLVMREVKLR